MKRLILWLATALGLLFALFVGLFFLNPLAAGILFAEITGPGYGHPGHPPALAEGQNVSSVQPNDKAEQNWKLIVTRHFPKGSSARDMVTTLHAQGFRILPKYHNASYDWGGMPCLFTVNVVWSEDAQRRISTINGSARSGCL